MATRRKLWSQRVTETSDALTLDRGVFARDDPASIARSLKRSAERSRRRKSSPYASAMSMLTFYLNRAGRTLPAARKRKIAAAKVELRRLYGRDEGAGHRSATRQRRRRRATRARTRRER